MEDSYTSKIDAVMDVKFSDDKSKPESALCIGSESTSNSGLSNTSLGITANEQNYISTSCVLSGSFANLTKEGKSLKNEPCGVKLHVDSILTNSDYLCVRNPASHSSNEVTFNEDCDKKFGLNINQHTLLEDNRSKELGKDNEVKVSGLRNISPSVIMKKVTPVKCSNYNFRKSKLLPTLVPRTISPGNMQGSVRLKRYPPISVRKMSLDNSACTKVDKLKLRPKLEVTCDKMISQHSAKCIQQGHIKCDFVCSLYKSDNWTKEDLSKNGETKSSLGAVKKISDPSISKDIFTNRSPNGDDLEQCVCSFCEKVYGWERMTCLKLHMPLPSSFMSPTTLMHHYGILFSVPMYGSNEKDSALVNICQVCYDLLLDGDAVYQKQQRVAFQMRQLWPKQPIDSKAFPAIPDTLNGNFPESSSQLDGSQSDKIICTSKGKKIIRRRRHPYILPRVSADPGSSLTASVPPRIELGSTTKFETDSGKPKKIRSKPLTCGLCGTDFYLEDQWEHHLENYHKIQEKWQRFTPNMHSKLRTHIINELIKSTGNDQQDLNTAKCSKSNTHMCYACESMFTERHLFVMHLRNYHNMTVDDDLLPGSECDHLGKSDSQNIQEEGSVLTQSKMMPDVDQILGSYYTKLSMHSADNKHKSTNDSGDEVNTILHMDNYENNMTTGDALLNNTYCQNVGDAHACKDFSGEDLDLSKSIDVKIDAQVSDGSNSITCLICDKKFELKKELETHLETCHLSSVVLKGDGSGGVLDYIVNVQGSDKALKKEGEESDLVLEESVKRASELMDWQSDNVLNSPFLSEDKQTVFKNNVDKAGVPQCLVYECEICGRRITGKKLLHNHLRRIHNITMNLQDDDPLYYCKHCLFRCSNRALLEKHRKDKHGKSKGMSQQQCETCGKIYSSAYIQEHVAVVHGNERKHSCEFCGMKFFDKKGVKSHIYFEHANKEWKCEKCQATFKKYHQLRQHTIYVHSTKEFKCEKCSKTFKRKGDLTEHIKRIHEKTILVCNYCSRQYRNSHKFRTHLVNVHGLSKEETYSQRYARHKRANNRLRNQSEKVGDLQTDKVLRIPEDSEVQDACIRLEKGEPEFQLVEVMETTNNDLEMDEVTVLILS